MIEVTQRVKFILQHPINKTNLEVVFHTDKDMDDWLPYLNKFEDYLIQEAIKAKKNQ